MSKKAFNAQKKEQTLLTNSQVPIITVSASYKEDLKGFLEQAENDRSTDIVLSRAHYSMALGVAVEAWGKKIDPQKAWLVDPTNHVSEKDWSGIEITNLIGKTIARWPILKTLKDIVDKFGRQKLPILDSITPATLFLTEKIERPILSFHIATGNILVENGRQVVEMITDPHVREDYLKNADNKNIKFCVFDEATKAEFFKVAAKLGKKIPQEQLEDKVIVTGPPVDPRIIKIGQAKKVWQNDRPLRILLSTGGLGTNKDEIKQVLKQLLPALQKKVAGMPDFELIFYAGTHLDHKKMATRLAKKYHVEHRVISPHEPADFQLAGDLINNKHAKLFSHQLQNKSKFHIIYHPQIVDANELLVHYGFPWADLYINKPSGDMAYDAALSGGALLTLREWGEWEHNVRQVFEDRSIAQKADLEQLISQLSALSQAQSDSITVDSKKPKSATRPIPQLAATDDKKTSATCWITQAMLATKKLEPIFYQGSKNILAAAKNAKF